MSNIRNQLDHINQRIKHALQTSGRPANTPVRLLAVSKRHSLDKIHSLYELGQRDFGESYVQEALDKIHRNEHKDIIWHFIGPIQSNKTRDIAENFHWVHSVDRVKIAQRLSDQRPEQLPPLSVCLQVNISQEPQKSGFTENELFDVFSDISKLPNLTLRGLMAIPKPEPDFGQQRLAFRQLHTLLQQLNKEFATNMDTLSMGMSNDLEAAIAEGATIIRIGTALFGARDS